MKYASVIPAVRFPKGTDGIFDYTVPDALAPFMQRGAWVVVPWRGKTVDGIVAEVKNERPTGVTAEIKEIAGLGSPVAPDPTLADTLLYVARRYFCSAGTVAKAVVPSTPKTKRYSAENAAAAQRRGPRPTSHKDHRTIREVVRYADPSWRDTETVVTLAPHVNEGRDALVIVPHAADAARMTDVLRAAFENADVVPVHGGLTAPQYRKAWHALLDAERATIAVGTRLAVFAPVRDLAAVVVHESDSPDLKQYDQNPRYDARSVAAKRALAADADMVFMSHGPRTEERALDQVGFTFREQQLQDDVPVLVDVNGKHNDADVAPLSLPVIEAIKTALHGQKRVVVLHNRRGEASALLCRECGHVFRCPRCEVAYAVHETTLRCHRCGDMRNVPTSCEKCGAGELRAFGIGTAGLESALARAFPDARIGRVDADKRDDDRTIPAGDIIVGTRALIHDIAESGDVAKDWGCAVATSLDDLLAHAGFRAGEEAWRTVRTLRDIAAISGGTCLLQTVDPENPKIRALVESDEAHADRETDARKDAGYPPFGTLIAVTVVAPHQADAERNAKTLADSLRREFGGAHELSVTGPIKPTQAFRHGKHRRIVVIKCAELTERLAETLLALPEACIIDRDPESLS
jgi:primosomal protein N' (replication factor Y)